MTLALLAMLPLVLALQPPATVKQRARPATPPAAATTATITVTDPAGAPLPEVRVNLTGSLDRSGSSQSDGTLKFDGLRPGTYRLRFTKEGYITLEREFEVRAGQPAPAPAVTLTPAPAAPKPPPPAAESPKPAALPPPGKAMTLSILDYIEQNFISNNQPQKVSQVGCTGLASTVLWQIREPWPDRSHPGADALLYVIGGEGTLRMDGRDTNVAAGSFASIPRATSYSLTRRGRNPLIVLATLAGEPCQ